MKMNADYCIAGYTVPDTGTRTGGTDTYTQVWRILQLKIQTLVSTSPFSERIAETSICKLFFSIFCFWQNLLNIRLAAHFIVTQTYICANKTFHPNDFGTLIVAECR